MNRPAHDDRQVARSLASLVEAFRRVARLSDRGWIEERDHVVSVATGMPLGAFNPTFVLAPPRDPEAAVARIRAFYARAGLADEISASGDAADAIADAARSGSTAPLSRSSTTRACARSRGSGSTSASSTTGRSPPP